MGRKEQSVDAAVPRQQSVSANGDAGIRSDHKRDHVLRRQYFWDRLRRYMDLQWRGLGPTAAGGFAANANGQWSGLRSDPQDSGAFRGFGRFLRRLRGRPVE